MLSNRETKLRRVMLYWFWGMLSNFMGYPVFEEGWHINVMNLIILFTGVVMIGIMLPDVEEQ